MLLILAMSIGKELQNLYDDVVAQPVPDRFSLERA